ncbi:hypothetical protein SADUNF_Sadunf13G0120400 [Salix dunnii]|uniref:Uncharacterized protein n=1 Tax=Salix dunnii TaxID=1413687 RepID=A0A835JPW1_9ROSI|nr:hypothetical protein SADUNF_Sadunf13G0120400 [Salix dunnii]
MTRPPGPSCPLSSHSILLGVSLFLIDWCCKSCISFAIYKLLSLISMAALQFFFLYFATLMTILIPVSAQLTPDFYDNVCPQALPTIRNIIKQAI